MMQPVPLEYSASAVALCLSFAGAHAADPAARLDTEKMTPLAGPVGNAFVELENGGFAGAGKAGVWTKATSVALCDGAVCEGKAGK